MNMKYIKLISILCLVFVFCGCVAGAEIEVSDLDDSYDDSTLLTVTPSGEIVLPVSNHGASDSSNDKISSVGDGNYTNYSNPHVDVHSGDSDMSSDDPLDQFINESFTFNIDFQNIGNQTGYQPIIELFVPKEIQINNNSFLGDEIKMELLGTCTAGLGYTLYDKYTNRTYYLGEEGEGVSLYVIHIPLGSYAPDEPTTSVVIDAKLDSNATYNEILNMTVNPIFRYGDYYIDDPTKYPPLYGETVIAYVNPDVVRITKTDDAEDGAEKVTGPNYQYHYFIDVDIANGQTINNVTITDPLPSQLMYVQDSLIVSYKGQQLTPDIDYTVVTPSGDTTGGNFVIKFNEDLVGGEEDIHLEYTVWAPRFDNSTGEDLFILDPDTADWNLTTNNATILCNYGNISINKSDSDNVTLKALAVQKHIYDSEGTPVSGGVVNVGQDLTYSLDFQVSDYFSLTNVVIDDKAFREGLGAGQKFVNDSMVLFFNNQVYNIPEEYYTVSEEEPSGRYTVIYITVRLSDFLHDSGIADNLTGSLNISDTLGPAIEGSVRFNVTVTSFYEKSNETSVSSQDSIMNDVRYDATLTSNSHPIYDDGASNALINPPDLSKSIYAVNNDTTRNSSDIDNPVKVNPGDNVTFLLDATVTTSVDSFTISDYLPSPLFSITSFNVDNSTTGEIPIVCHWAYAEDSELPYDKEGNIINPEVKVDLLNNRLSFYYGDIFDEDHLFHLKIMFTVTVSYEHFADGLYLTNLLSIDYQDSANETYHNETIVGFILNEPELTINKTVEVLDNNISGYIQGGTIARYTIDITNIGHFDAYDVILCDNFTENNPGTVLDFKVYSNGTEIPVTEEYKNNFFNPSKGYNFGHLDWARNGTGLNGIKIVYTVNYTENNIPSALISRENSTELVHSNNITNIANITNFASITGGPNYATDQSKYSDDAVVYTALLDFDKKFIGSKDYNSTFGDNVNDSNRKQNITIGEVCIFNLTINLPNLNLINASIRDTLPNGLYIIEDGYNVSYNNVRFSGDFRRDSDTFYFVGVLTPTGGVDVDHTITLQLYCVAEDNIGVFNLNTAIFNLENVAELRWFTYTEDNKTQYVHNVQYDNVTVCQPILDITKKFADNYVEGLDNDSFTIVIKNKGKSSSFNNVISDDLTELIDKFIAGKTKAGLNISISGNKTPVNITWDDTGKIVYFSIYEIVPDETITVRFNFTVKDDLYVGDNLTNIGYWTGNSTPENKHNETRLYNVQDSDVLISDALGIRKSVINTSIPENRMNVTIGENVTFNITIHNVHGNYSALNVTDKLPSDFGYVPGSLKVYVNGTLFDQNSTYFNVTNPTARYITLICSNEFARYVIDHGGYFTILLNATRLNSSSSSSSSVTNNAYVRWNDGRENSSSAKVYLIEPNVTIEKKFNVTKNVSGGQDLKFTIVVNNTKNSPLYNTTIRDDLTEFFKNYGNESTFVLKYLNGTELPNGTVVNWDGKVLIINAGTIPNKGSFTFEAFFKVRNDIYVGSNYTNVANVTGASVPIENENYRLYNATDNDTFYTKALPIVKSVINTTIENGDDKATIGEIVCYNINVTLVTGNYSDLNVTDILPEGFEFVDGSLFIYINGNPYTSNWTYNVEGRRIFIDLDNDFAQYAIQNSRGVFNIRLNATVLNKTLNNKSSDIKTNLAELRWNEGNYANSTANVTIVEPNIIVTKEFHPDKNIQGGDLIDFVINTTNNGSSPLFNVTIEDDLSELITRGVMDSDKDKLNITILEGNTTGELSYEFVSNVLVITVPEIGINQSVALKVEFKVLDNIVITLENYTNRVNVTGYSDPARLDDNHTRAYMSNASDVFTTKLPTIDKSVNYTSIEDNGLTNVTIGENVTYYINISLPYGKIDLLIVNESLPNGIELLDYDVIEGREICGFYEFDYDTGIFTFTNILAKSDCNYILIELDAVVNNDSSKGQLKVNTVDLILNSTVIDNSTANVTVVEPDVDITKTVNKNKDVQGNDVLKYTIVVKNTGNSPLFDTIIIDNLTELLSKFTGKVNITGPGARISGSIFTANIDKLLVNETVTYTLVFKINDDVILGSNHTNVANVTGSSVPSGSDYYKVYKDTDDAFFDTADPSITKVVNSTSVSGNGKLNATIGENVTYLINVTTHIGKYENLTIVDTLPKGLEFVSAVLGNGSEVHPVSGTTFEFSNYLSDGSDLLIYLTAVVTNDSSNIQNATKINNVVLYSNGTKFGNDSAKINIVEPDVDITKTVNKTKDVQANDELCYTIVVTNNGSSILYNTTIVDDLTELLVNVTDSVIVTDESGAKVGTITDGILTINVGELAINQSKTYKLLFKVKADFIIYDNETYINIANVTGSSVPDDNKYYKVYNDSDNANFTVILPTINKTVVNSSIGENGKFNVTIGETVTYLLNITNITGLYTNLTVVDTLPEGFEFVSAVLGNGSEVRPVSGTTFEFSNYLSDGSDLLIYLTAVVLDNPSNVNGTIKENIVDLYLNGVHEDNSSDNVTIVEPAISIVKNITNNTSKFNATETVQYHIVIENTGDSPAFMVTITDELDSGLVYLDKTSCNASGWTFDYDTKTRVLTIYGEHLAVGESVAFDFECGFDVIGKNITNLANVNISSVNGTNNSRTYNNSSKTDIYVVATDIQVTKICTSEVVAGLNVTYDVTVICNGPDKAFNVTLQELFDSSYLSNVQYSVNGSEWKSIENEGIVVLGDMNNGDSYLINVRGLLNHSALGVLNNTVKVTTDTNETNYTNNVDTNLTNITTRTEIDVLKLSNETRVIAGNNISYNITVTIKGPSDARNVTLVDVYDVSLLLDMEYSLDGINWNKYTNGTIINLGDILAKTSKVVYFRANVNASTHEEKINNTVTIDTVTPHNGTNTSTNITPIDIVANITIDKVANVTDVNPGEYINYTIVVGSTGISNSTNVTLVDILNTTYLDVSEGYYSVDGEFRGLWNGSVYLDTMCPGQNITIVIYNLKVKDVDDYNVNNTIPNVANVTSYNVPEGKTDDAYVLVNLVDVAVEKNMTHGNYTDEIVFTINVTNNGPNSTSNVVLKDIIPTPDFIYTGYTSSVGRYDVDSGLWYVGDLNVGQVEYLYITCIINKTGYVENNVTVENYTGHDTNMSNNNDTVNDTIPFSCDLAVNKTVESFGNYTENIVYVIVATNNGPDNATGVIVSDSLPKGIVFINASENVTYEIDLDGNEYINWTIGDLAVGQNVTLKIICLINTTGNVTNFVNITGNEHDWNLSNNYDNVTVEIPPAADLSVNKTANLNTVTIGDKVVYTIVVINNGPDTAPNAYAIDKLPDGLKFVSYKASVGSYDPNTGIWTIGDLPVGKKVTLILHVVATKVGIIDNEVIVGSDAFDVNESNNVANFTIEVKDINKNTNLISMERTGAPLFALVLVILLFAIGITTKSRWRK